MKKSTVLRTRNPNSPINFVIHNSNITVYGLKDIEIRQIKYVYKLMQLAGIRMKMLCGDILWRETCFQFQRIRSRPKEYENWN